MLSLHRTLSPRYLWRRRSRALLVILSIALGVATLVATRSLSQSMTQAARDALTPLALNWVSNGVLLAVIVGDVVLGRRSRVQQQPEP